MLLRRITKHVKDQNWFAVGIDFVIVVIGVFIGLQVANWNDARSDRQLGQEYAQRLIADLEQDLAATRSLKNYYAQVLESVEDADRLLAKPDSDSKALVVAAYRASEYNDNPPNTATWDEIVSSGHLKLLPTDAVKNGLGSYYKFRKRVADSEEIRSSEYRKTVRALIPLSVQLAIRNGCSDTYNELNVASGFVSDCQIDVEDALLTDVAENLRASDAVKETLRHQYSLVAFLQINNDGDIAGAENALALLTQIAS
ncbi:MAG: DUF6090 family protein [Pseudomonadota bacterium]